jgi:hypothetical protein
MRRSLLVTVGILVVSSLAGAAAPPGQKPATPGAPGTKVLTSRVVGNRPGTLTTIQGNALDSTNGVLPSTLVRLRDARLGRIVDSQVTDSAGMFEFKGIEPGSYIVEIMGNEQGVLAASQMLNVSAGDAISAVVKLPFRISPFAGVFGNSTASAILVTAAAASAGVLSAAATQSVSPGS